MTEEGAEVFNYQKMENDEMGTFREAVAAVIIDDFP